VRALRFDGESLRLSPAAPEPAPAPGEALVRPSRVLLGPADTALVQRGAHAGFSGVVGHQFVGVVKKIELPSDAPPLLAARRSLLGKRVVASPMIACGACDLCRSGLPMHCRSRTVIGLAGRDGCAAECVALPLSSLCTVPDAVSDDEAAFAHTLSAALHAAILLRNEHSSYVTVLGDSALALLTAQALARQNKAVRVLSSTADRSRLCEKWGIKNRPLEEAGRRQDQDVVVDCTGSSSGLRLALQLVRPRGTVLLQSPLAVAPFPAGRPLPEPAGAWAAPVDLTIATVNEVRIMGSRDGPIADAVGALTDRAIDVVSLISKRFKLDDGIKAFDAAREHPSVLLDI
jgi:alcohol dehydrogenase